MLLQRLRKDRKAWKAAILEYNKWRRRTCFPAVCWMLLPIRISFALVSLFQPLRALRILIRNWRHLIWKSVFFTGEANFSVSWWKITCRNEPECWWLLCECQTFGLLLFSHVFFSFPLLRWEWLSWVTLLCDHPYVLPLYLFHAPTSSHTGVSL